MAITLWRGAGKSRVREEMHGNEKRGLESTEKAILREPRSASLRSCQSPYVAARPSRDRQGVTLHKTNATGATVSLDPIRKDVLSTNRTAVPSVRRTR